MENITLFLSYVPYGLRPSNSQTKKTIYKMKGISPNYK